MEPEYPEKNKQNQQQQLWGLDTGEWSPFSGDRQIDKINYFIIVTSLYVLYGIRYLVEHIQIMFQCLFIL